MANNCLVTKLRGVVDNPDLLKMDEIRVTVNVPENVSHPGGYYIGNRIEANSDVTVKIIEGDGVFYSDETRTVVIGREYTIPANTLRPVWISNGINTISISNKYNLTRYNFMNGYNAIYTTHANGFGYMPYLSMLGIANVEGTIYLKNIKSTRPIKYFALSSNNNNIIGDLSEFDFSELEQFVCGNQTRGLTGKFIDVVNVNLANLYPDKFTSIEFCSVEDIVHRLRTLGKVTGTITLNWCGTSTENGITIGGEELNSIGVNSPNARIEWTTTTISIVRSDGTVVRSVNA